MVFLNVPYADKDQAKALGARWHPASKRWYVPSGQPSEPFTRWMPLSDKTDSVQKDNSTRVRPESSRNSELMVGRVQSGVRYFDIGHDCNPFEECPICKPMLLEKGWLAPDGA